jgi:hypothetical protein
MAKLFFAYSHADEALRDRLEKALAVLKRQGIIESWHDRRITPGADFSSTIDTHINEADVILLLVSQDFLASDYCYEIEVRRAMERQRRGEAHVVPVILRPSQWEDSPFGHLQALPTDGKAVTKYADQDDAFLDIANGIKRLLGAKATTTFEPDWTQASRHESLKPVSIRSSNLALRKTFSEADEDRFLDETFEFMARFFENSLEELERRNPGVTIRFRRLDSDAFTAAAYRNGEKIARCKIFFGGMMGKGIAYSESDDGSRGGLNENLTVIRGDSTLGLRPLAFGSFASDLHEQFLTVEGAAELYWAKFMEPLQR